MSDIPGPAMSHNGPKKDMPTREDVARQWHQGSDHAADGEPFGGPLCNCKHVADRIVPMLRKAWYEGYDAGEECALTAEQDDHECVPNPYESEEDRHVDQ